MKVLEVEAASETSGPEERLLDPGVDGPLVDAAEDSSSLDSSSESHRSMTSLRTFRFSGRSANLVKHIGEGRLTWGRDVMSSLGHRDIVQSTSWLLGSRPGAASILDHLRLAVK